MLVTFGQPLTYSTSTSFESWEECLDACWEDDECMMVYQPNDLSCELYRFGEINTVTRMTSLTTDWTRVAFRKTIPDTCPVATEDSNPPLFDEKNSSDFKISGQTVTQWTLTETESLWNFNYTTTTCPSTSTPFVRQYAVCVELRLFSQDPFYGNQANATALCAANGGMSLTGAYNSEEYDWLLAQTTSKLNALTGAAATTWPLDKSLFWLDGKSNTVAQQFDMVDDSHYNPNYTYPIYGFGYRSVTNMCLGMPFSGEVYDSGCAVTIAIRNSVNFYFRGAFCRIRPL